MPPVNDLSKKPNCKHKLNTFRLRPKVNVLFKIRPTIHKVTTQQTKKWWIHCWWSTNIDPVMVPNIHASGKASSDAVYAVTVATGVDWVQCKDDLSQTIIIFVNHSVLLSYFWFSWLIAVKSDFYSYQLTDWQSSCNCRKKHVETHSI